MHLDNQKIWESVLTDIELNISKANFKTWFKDIALKEITEKNLVIIAVPSEFIKKWILEKFHPMILKNFIKIKPEIRNVEYVVEKIDTKNITTIIAEKKEKKTTPLKQKLDDSLNKKTLSLNLTLKNGQTNLNPKYQFDTFVVGSFNEIAATAAQAILKRKEVVYNPLLI
ncbi:MAG: hypothetical protein KAI16_01240, partial [Candidatus Pacebacteria bacterium]|nr:hypothetical protein [Candidatus Paceibacterota bacterium]